ncbi:hypothetical protein B9K06_23075 [Bacillus sp. OG2]|nr:hypothetical protein B9K06_23075 [Bacillus sp. OG2]
MEGARYHERTLSLFCPRRVPGTMKGHFHCFCPRRVPGTGRVVLERGHKKEHFIIKCLEKWRYLDGEIARAENCQLVKNSFHQ